MALCEIRWQRGYRSGAFVAVGQNDAAEEVAKSPKFRSRRSGAAPPESPEIVSCLEALEAALAAAGWERIDGSGGEWCARRFRRGLAPLSERVGAYVVGPDDDMIAWLSAQTTAPAHEGIETAGDDSARVIAAREAGRRRELKRLEAERLQDERLLLTRSERAARARAARRRACRGGWLR